MADDDSVERVPKGLLSDVLVAYHRFLREQGAAASALARWTKASKRSLDFAWVGGEQAQEELVLQGKPVEIQAGGALFDPVKRMHTTATLNPYEREVLYGYPFVIGRRAGKTIRGPVLTVPVAIGPRRDGFVVEGAEESLRFNALPFRADEAIPTLDHAIATMLEQETPWPLGLDGLADFAEVFFRTFNRVEREARLDGTLADPPQEPTGGNFLRIIDQAAIFVAPRTNYFLASDLEAMAGEEVEEVTALDALLRGGGDEVSPEFSSSDLDGRPLFFPFPSNRAQRRIALLLDDDSTEVVRVEGPPGTGKSLTIANLACHLTASGKTVLITSQRDKALQVVDAKLRELGVPGFPMTLLRHDADAKRELLNRLADVRKERGRAEVEQELQETKEEVSSLAIEYVETSEAYEAASDAEAEIEAAARSAASSAGVRALFRRLRLRRVLSRADRHTPAATDELARRASSLRRGALTFAAKGLEVSAELGVAAATRAEKQHLNALAHVLKRNQRSAKNYSLFDRMKRDPTRAHALLSLLPVWILAPDDVARLFPCEAGLFDVVIVDEASQVDLPSVFPVLFRGKKLVASGDTKQMQPKRFAFAAQSVATQAWQPVTLHDHSLVDLLNPADMSLLELAFVMAQEENLLDEHFRSLPPIIDFSNTRWYGGRLRVMTDERRKRFGSPDQPLMQLHHVADGQISNGSQENENEAKALVAFLSRLFENPDYAGASIGVLCLFEEQIALVQDLIADQADEQQWADHDLVVVNPDGFQGDERDVILYSLSFDNDVMPKSALSARQQESKHVQGMLNVAFTRARDEVHVFHSGPIETFFKEDGKGAIGDWLAHIARVQERGRAPRSHSRLGRVDSEFEAEVAEALRQRGVEVTHQYPACGFFMDLVCELNEERVAVECDGEPWHTDEHGRTRVEDLERLAVLERAGWRVVNIPYRKWLRAPGEQVQRVLNALEGWDENDNDGGQTDHSSPQATRKVGVTREQDSILRAVREGHANEDEVLRRARELLGHKRLGKRMRESLLRQALDLNHEGLLVMEEGEYFLTPRGRTAEPVVASIPPATLRQRTAAAPHKRAGAGRAPRYGRCACGGRLVVRNGPYGRFLGCSNFPRCRRSRPY